MKTILLDTNKFMVSKSILIVFVASAFLLFANMQCNTETPPPVTPTQPDGLPLETQEGKNTFGCYWNDTLWLPESGIGIPGQRCTYYVDSNWLNITVYKDTRRESFSFFLTLNGNGYYEFDDIYPNKVEIYRSKTTWMRYICAYSKGLK